jgi:parafibromin
MSNDPLSLLREYTINKLAVVLLDANNETVDNISNAKSIKFNDNSIFPRDTPTNFKKTNDSKDTYTLETLIFLVQNAQLDNSAYFKECRTRQIEHVSIVDRRKILDYLTGKVDQSPNVLQTGTSGNYLKFINIYYCFI